MSTNIPREFHEASKTHMGRDFSDRVQGEDLEFHASSDHQVEMIHGADLFGSLEPHRLFSKLSASQMITLSGAASGFLAGVVVCPLDVVKTRLQAQGALAQDRDHRIKIDKKYRGFIGAFKTIIREEGPRGLYRGLVPITIGYLPTWAIYFTVYEQAKGFYPKFLRSKFDVDMDSLNHFCSAITAGMTSSVAVNPIWVVKTRLMIQTGTGATISAISAKNSGSLPSTERTYYRGTLHAFKTMYKEEGIRVFYSGLIPSLFGLLHVGIHFPVYEKLKDLLNCNMDMDSMDRPKGILGRLIAASAVAKMVASTITYPHEILRTRMQIQSTKNDKAKKSDGKLLDSIFRIYKKEGLKGFYAGYGINLARTVPASAVTLVSFEYFKNYLLDISGNK